MTHDLVLKNIERHENEIDELRKQTMQLEKTQSNIELSLQHLTENINALSSSVDKLSNDVQEIKNYIDSSKTTKQFIKSNWFRLPLIVGAVLYAANWLYDLPSPKQLEQMQQLTEMRASSMHHDNQ